MNSEPAVVRPFRPRQEDAVSVFADQLMGTLEIMPLAFAIFRQEQFEKRIDRALEFYPVPGKWVIEPEERTKIIDRAFIAMNLGDPAKRDAMLNAGAMAILRVILRKINAGEIDKASPLAKLDLSTARLLATLAVDAALDSLAGNPMRPATTSKGGEQ